MVFGYSTNAFVRFSLAESIKKIAGLGFGGVEIMCDRPHLYPGDFNETDLKNLRDIIHDHHLRITNLNSFTLFAVGDTYLPSWIETEADRREIRIRHTLDCLRIAKFLGCGNISVPPGGPLNGMPLIEAFSLFHQGLERVIPLAEELGVKVLVEPEPGLMIENTREFRSFIKEIRSKSVGVNFDMGHFFCAGEDPTRAFENLFEWVGHVHLEDIAEDRKHNHLIPGHGSIHFPGIFNVMKQLNYRGDISLELYPYAGAPEDAGKQGLEFLLPIFKKAGIHI
jgi:sugar phosphate isomerase/epimerase